MRTPPPVFVINLDGAEFRRKRMASLLKKVDVEPRFVAAVDGRSVASHTLQTFLRSDEWELSDSELGCMLSHLRAWSLVAESSAEYGVILEDDLHISSSFRDVIEAFRPPRDELAVWRLEHTRMRMTAARRAKAVFEGFHTYQIFTNHGGAGAYMLNRQTALHLSQEARKLRLAIDTEMFDPSRRSIGGFSVFQVHPAPCIQDSVLRSDTGGPLASGIAGSRVDDTILGARRSRYESLKAPLRPLYTRACSLALLPKGKFRLRSQHARDLLEDKGIEA